MDSTSLSNQSGSGSIDDSKLTFEPTIALTSPSPDQEEGQVTQNQPGRTTSNSKSRSCVRSGLRLRPALAHSQARPRLRHLRLVLLGVALIGLALSLGACGYPGQDPPCAGVNAGTQGCTNPVATIKDEPDGGDWYVAWALNIIRTFLSSLAINAVKLGVSVFWSIFTSLASLDFAGCKPDSTTPTCLTVSTFEDVRVLALVFIPLILGWKFFKSYIVGGFVRDSYESALSFVPKVIIGGVVIAYLAVIVSGAFGMSNILFTSILGGTNNFFGTSAAIVGSTDIKTIPGGPTVKIGSGFQSIQGVNNIGLMVVFTLLGLVICAVFILLGLCFFLRTILVFILFCLSPLAIVAALTEEFRPWFSRWLGAIQMLLVAPLPVAVCLSLIFNFVGKATLPAAAEDPANFLLLLIYVISFLLIGTILMFKIAGSTGGFMFGLAVAGAASLGGFVAGKVAGGGAGNSDSSGGSTNGGSNQGAGAGSGSGSGSGSEYGAAAATANRPLPAGGGGGGSAGAASGFSFEGGAGGAGQQQSQTELIGAMRALNAHNSAVSMQAVQASSSSYRAYTGGEAGGGYSGGAGAGRSGGSGGGFNHRVHDNIQSVGQWAGREADLSSPYISFAPQRGGGGNGNGNGSGRGDSSVEAQSSSYSSFQLLFDPAAQGGTDGNGNGGASSAQTPGRPPSPSPSSGGGSSSGSGSGSGSGWGGESYAYSESRPPITAPTRDVVAAPRSTTTNTNAIDPTSAGGTGAVWPTPPTSSTNTIQPAFETSANASASMASNPAPMEPDASYSGAGAGAGESSPVFYSSEAATAAGNQADSFETPDQAPAQAQTQTPDQIPARPGRGRNVQEPNPVTNPFGEAHPKVPSLAQMTGSAGGRGAIRLSPPASTQTQTQPPVVAPGRAGSEGNRRD